MAICRQSAIAVVAAFIASGAAAGQPRQVMLIRHAEKPADDDSIHLSAEGQRRAEALSKLFERSRDRPDPFPKPDFIFATRPSKHSNRPVETVTPLAKSLNRYLFAEFENDEYSKLAAELLTNSSYKGKAVLVCWHHGTIADLARKLNAADVPDHWKDSAFDRVWVITYSGGSGTLQKRHQHLMPVDDPD
jgi:broad specificity phosphatase PhoE